MFRAIETITRAPLWCAGIGCCCLFSAGSWTIWRQSEHSKSKLKQRVNTCAGTTEVSDCKNQVTTFCPDCKEAYCDDCLAPGHATSPSTRKHSNFVDISRKPPSRKVSNEQHQLQKLIDKELLDDLEPSKK
eukprot:TRINITY_DN10871_c0_g1_i1.p1 TRINITY_DN10871_c0_g1~~TRINITY_DN10871_c0_g1_i1.p1  ORF type:complete len:144 (+),score=17.81 TRINITY_DN10871_c0_g1_i1:42-434(+)